MLASETPEGFLRFDARLTRVGVFEYGDGDGNTWGELRTDTEVFEAEAISSFFMSTVTNDHPEEFVSVANVDGLCIGTVGTDVRRDGDYLVATIQVTDARAIADIRAGKIELSCGYTAQVVTDVGVSDGIPHRGRQTHIRGNHVALVDRGRAGPMCRLITRRGDASQYHRASMYQVDIVDKEGKTKTIEVADKAVAELLETQQDALLTAKKTADVMEAELKKAEALSQKKKEEKKKEEEEDKKKKMKGDALLEEMAAKLDTLEAAAAPDVFARRVDERSRLVDDATLVLDATLASIRGVSDAALMRRICDHIDPTAGARIDAHKDSPTYLQATYEQAMVLHGRADRQAVQNHKDLYGAGVVHQDGGLDIWADVIGIHDAYHTGKAAE
jgi:hypothetical protein